MKIKVTRNLTYLEARKIVEHTPETTFSTIVQSAIAKPEIKKTITLKLQKMTKSSLPVLKFLYQQNIKQISLNHHQKLQHLNLNNQVHHKLNQQKNRESRSKNRTSPRKKSQSPKKNQRDKIKLTRVQDEPIKLKNTFSDLEQMEAEEYSDQKSRKDQTK